MTIPECPKCMGWGDVQVVVHGVQRWVACPECTPKSTVPPDPADLSAAIDEEVHDEKDSITRR